MRVSFQFLVALTIFAGSSNVSAADWTTKTLEAWIPADVIAFARIEGAGDASRALIDSELRQRFEKSVIGQHLYSQRGYKKFLEGVGAIEQNGGEKVLDLFHSLFGREVAGGARLGFGGPEFIVLSRGENAKALTATIGKMRKVIEGLGQVWPFDSPREYHGVGISSTKNFAFATVGNVLALSNSPNGIKSVVDLARGERDNPLTISKAYKSAAKIAKKGQLATLVVRPRFIPNFEVPEKANNFLVSLLFGAALGTMQDSDLVVAGLDGGKNGLQLEVSARVANDSFEKKFASYFPSVETSSLLRRLEKKGVLGYIQLHRDFSSWWDLAEDVVDRKGLGEMREFSNIMSLVFGKPFDDEVLPELLPTITLVTGRQSFSDLESKPKPALPGFAGILEMRNPDQFSKNFQAALQSLVGIINIDQAQKNKGAGLLLVEPELVGGATLMTVNRITKGEAADRPGMEYNFSPSLATVGHRVVISSSKELARVLVKELSAGSKGKKKASKTAVASTSKDLLNLRADSLRSVLHDNLDVFVANAMVEKGQSREEAKGEISALLEVLEFLRDLRIDTRVDDGFYRARVRVRASSSR